MLTMLGRMGRRRDADDDNDAVGDDEEDEG